LIHVYGTSHVSKESLELVDEKISQHDPDIVALELDFLRLNSLLKDSRRSSGPLFIRLVQKFQQTVGRKTGVMPGEEMLYAYRKAVDQDRDIALIDQNIKETVKRLKQVRSREKIKAILSVLVSYPFSRQIDLTKIPEEEFIDELLYELEFKFPGLHAVLVEERNRYMIKALKQLQENNPDSDIVAFVGAAHRKEIEQSLEKNID